MVKARSDALVRVLPVSFPSYSGTATIRGKVWMSTHNAVFGSAFEEESVFYDASFTEASAQAADSARHTPSFEELGPLAPTATIPKGIVQIVHGMAEYIDRYDEFARYLVSLGYVVAGNDHLGHGESVKSKEEWGDLPPKTGKDALIKDVHMLRTIMQERYGTDVPYIMFGHSMGSFVVRAYIARYAQGLSGAIICGTGHQPRAKSRAGNRAALGLVAAKGAGFRSTMMHGMADGAYAKAFKDEASPLAWLNSDPEAVALYEADEACGFMFTVGGYAVLTDLTHEIALPRTVQKVPDDLPLLFIAGSDDPVGDAGAGVKTVFRLYRNAKKNARCTLYKGMRHEILNEPRREIVFTDIAAWLEEAVNGEEVL